MSKQWSALAVAALLATTSARGFLNVRDFGASGSAFETSASTRAGSNRVLVEDVGDFRVGQQVMVSKCHVHYEDCRLRGPGSPYRKWKRLEGEVEIRGFDGSVDGWLPVLIDIDSVTPVTFRWTGDLGKTWKGRVPVTGDWQGLTAGIQVRFRKDGWKLGHVVQFVARTQLVSTIEKIDGNALWLGTAPNRTVKDAVVRHCDTQVIQAVVRRAIAEKKNVLFPNGRYRLSSRIYVQNAAIRIEGESAEHTIMDITQGVGPVFSLLYGERVTIRNFRMIGHGSRAAGHGGMRTSSGFPFWVMALKHCKAVQIKGTRHVLVENVYASQMASECFYSQGPYRHGPAARKNCTESITYLRCWVEDCAHNAFNNNDAAEGTNVLYCRVENVGAYAYEGPGRFIRIEGNYVRNCGGGFVVGNMEGRHDHFRELGCGQAVIKGNVLEGTFSTRAAVDITRGAGQVTVADNLSRLCRAAAPPGPVGRSAEERLPGQCVRTVRGDGEADTRWPVGGLRPAREQLRQDGEGRRSEVKGTVVDEAKRMGAMSEPWRHKRLSGTGQDTPSSQTTETTS